MQLITSTEVTFSSGTTVGGVNTEIQKVIKWQYNSAGQMEMIRVFKTDKKLI
ncbi:MAG: hypothetical protein WDO19_12990 [Bacteroidota bacterium]